MNISCRNLGLPLGLVVLAPLLSCCAFIVEPMNTGLAKLNRGMTGAPAIGKGAQPELVGTPYSEGAQALVDTGFIRDEDMRYFLETGYVPPNGLISSGGLTDGSRANLFFGTVGVLAGDALMASDLASVRAKVVRYFESGFFAFPENETESLIKAICDQPQEREQAKCSVDTDTARNNYIYSVGKEKYRTLGPGIPVESAKAVADKIRGVVIFEGIKVSDNHLVTYTLTINGKQVSPALGECWGGGLILGSVKTIPPEFSHCNIFTQNAPGPSQ